MAETLTEMNGCRVNDGKQCDCCKKLNKSLRGDDTRRDGRRWPTLGLDDLAQHESL